MFQEGLRCIDERRGIVVAGRNDCLEARHSRDAVEEPVIEFLRPGAGRSGIKNIPGDQHGIDLFFFYQLIKPGKELFELLIPFVPAQRAAKVPVGGMEDLHGKTLRWINFLYVS